MATTTYIDKETVITADTMNDVDFLTYNIFGGASSIGADGSFWVSNGSNYVEESGSTARTSLGATAGVWPITLGGTGATTLTDGGILLGSGTGAITALSVMADGEMVVGDGTTDPVLESGATLRTSIGVSIGTDVQAYSAAAAKIETGTYTGDGTTSQVISLSDSSIVIKYVLINSQETDGTAVGTHYSTDVIVDDDVDGGAIWEDSTSGIGTFSDNAIIALGTGSFTVDDAGSNFNPNMASQVYNYLVIGI